jgi:hypothetical protein
MTRLNPTAHPLGSCDLQQKRLASIALHPLEITRLSQAQVNPR